MNRTRTLSIRTLSAAAAALVALALAGCAPTGGAPTGSADPEPTVTVTVTPEPGAPRPDYGFTFFEDATMGSTWDQMSAQLHYPVAGINQPWNDSVCPWYGPIWNTELATTYAFMDSTNPATGVRFFYTYDLAGTGGSAFPRNAEGVGVGSTQAQIVAAYPGAVVDSYTDMGAGDMTRITVDDPDSDSKYVFAISDGGAAVNMLQWGPDAGSQWSHLCTGF